MPDTRADLLQMLLWGGEDEISHDKLFKTAFFLFLKDLMELVHPELAATLDLDDVELADKDLFADFRKAGHAEPDLVAKTKTYGGEPRTVHVEVENASGAGPGVVDALRGLG